ncbi:MAG: PIN domain-containing protein [Patescibacteria group bacterium]
MAAITRLTSLLSKHRRIAIDSSIFIYAFEEHRTYGEACASVFEYSSTHEVALMTSVISFSEILVQPVQKKDPEVIALYENLFSTLPNFFLLDITRPVAKTAAYLRAAYSILLSDAYQLAAPLHHGATLFITNDKRLKKVQELSVVCLDDLVV